MTNLRTTTACPKLTVFPKHKFFSLRFIYHPFTTSNADSVLQMVGKSTFKLSFYNTNLPAKFLFHPKLTPALKFVILFLYTWAKRDIVRVPCPRTEYYIKTLNRATRSPYLESWPRLWIIVNKTNYTVHWIVIYPVIQWIVLTTFQTTRVGTLTVRSLLLGPLWFTVYLVEIPLQRKQAFLERFYENRRRFLLLLPDGTGSC